MDPNLLELLSAGEQEEVKAIIRLASADTAPRSVRIVSRFGDIATCRLPASRIVETWADETVLSLKAAKPYGQGDDDREDEERIRPASFTAGDIRRPEELNTTGRGVIVALIDWGFDFGHPNFRNEDGSTRIIALWDQSSELMPHPEPYGYGRVFTRAEIDQALQSDEPYRTLGYHPGKSDLRSRGMHGTHVCDIAAGNGLLPGSLCGLAPEAELLLVHASSLGAKEPSNLGDSVTLLEALDWIRTQAGTRPCVVNMSVGRQAGPHTGLTLAEQCIDQLLTEAPGRSVVQSGGNYYSSNAHASGQLLPGQTRTLRWRIDPGDRSPNELEIWYGKSDAFSVTLTPPDGEHPLNVRLGGHAPIKEAGQIIGRFYHRARDPGRGDNLVDIFLYPQASPGEWLITLFGEDIVDGRYHCWVERDAACKHCQSRLAPSDADPRSTTGTICNGHRNIAVGAYDPHDPDRFLGRFSSAGPTVDGRIKPDLIAPGVDVWAAKSTPPHSDVPKPGLTVNSGTSMAAPHVTGAIANMFQAAGRPLTISETRRLLLSTAEPVRHIDESDRDRVGSGYLDVLAAVEATSEWVRMHPDPPHPADPEYVSEVAEAAYEETPRAFVAAASPGTSAVSAAAPDSALECGSSDLRGHCNCSDTAATTVVEESPEPPVPASPPFLEPSVPVPEPGLNPQFIPPSEPSVTPENASECGCSDPQGHCNCSDAANTTVVEHSPEPPTVPDWPPFMEPLILAPEPDAAHDPEPEPEVTPVLSHNEEALDEDTLMHAEEFGNFAWEESGEPALLADSMEWNGASRVDTNGSEPPAHGVVTLAPQLIESGTSSLPGRRLAHNQMIIRPRGTYGESYDDVLTSDLLTPPAVRGGHDYILWVQRGLNHLFDLGLIEDGIFGPQTSGAVRSFQQQHGLVPDGIVGSKTEAVLVDLLGLAAKPQTDKCIGIGFPEVLNGFEYDKAKVLPSHQKQLIRIAACIVSRHGTAGAISRVHMIGHTDASGDESYNEGLGLSRAEAVRAALKDRLRDRAPHLNLHRDDVLPMTVDSRGETEPRFPTDTENRRVEIFIPELQPPPKKKKKKKKKPKPDILEDTVKRSTQVLIVLADSFPDEQRGRLTCLLAAALNPEVDNDLYINGKDFIVRQLIQGVSPELPPREFVRLVARERVRRDLRNPLFAPPGESDEFVAGSLKALDERILSGINLIADQSQRNSELNVNNPVLRQMQKFVSAAQRDPKSMYFCYGIGQH